MGANTSIPAENALEKEDEFSVLEDATISPPVFVTEGFLHNFTGSRLNAGNNTGTLATVPAPSNTTSRTRENDLTSLGFSPPSFQAPFLETPTFASVVCKEPSSETSPVEASGDEIIQDDYGINALEENIAALASQISGQRADSVKRARGCNGERQEVLKCLEAIRSTKDDDDSSNIAGNPLLQCHSHIELFNKCVQATVSQTLHGFE